MILHKILHKIEETATAFTVADPEEGPWGLVGRRRPPVGEGGDARLHGVH